ncbi:hypothetical protein D3C78_1135230 [compost metagenome]
MEIAPEDPRALVEAQGRPEEAAPEALVHHQPGDQRSQHRQAEQRHQVPAPAVAVGPRHQPPAMQGAGELAEVEQRAAALHPAAVGVHVQRGVAAIRVADFGLQREMAFAGHVQPLQRGAGLLRRDGGEDGVMPQARGVVVWRAGAHRGVGQPDDLLAHGRQGAGDAHQEYEEPDRQGQPAMHQEPGSGTGFLGHGKSTAGKWKEARRHAPADEGHQRMGCSMNKDG